MEQRVYVVLSRALLFIANTIASAVEKGRLIVGLISKPILPLEIAYAFDLIEAKFGDEQGNQIINRWYKLANESTEVSGWENSFPLLETGLTYPTVSPAYQIYRQTYRFHQFVSFSQDVPVIANEPAMSILVIPEPEFKQAVKDVFATQPENQIGQPVFLTETEITSRGDWVADVANAWVLLDDKIVDVSHNVSWSFARLQSESAMQVNELADFVRADMHVNQPVGNGDLKALITWALESAENFEQRYYKNA